MFVSPPDDDLNEAHERPRSMARPLLLLILSLVGILLVLDQSFPGGLRRIAYEAVGQFHRFEYELEARMNREPVAHSSNPPYSRLKKIIPIDEASYIRFTNTVSTAAYDEKLDPDLLRAIIAVSSNFNPRLVSPSGAKGLFQLDPATARRLGVKDPLDGEQNIKAGARYFAELLERSRGNEDKALAAFHSGQGHVSEESETSSSAKEFVDQVRAAYAALSHR